MLYSKLQIKTTKTPNFQTVFSQDWETFLKILKSRSNRDWKGFNINYHCTQSDDYLWCAKISEFAQKKDKKKKKLKLHLNTKLSDFARKKGKKKKKPEIHLNKKFLLIFQMVGKKTRVRKLY